MCHGVVGALRINTAIIDSAIHFREASTSITYLQVVGVLNQGWGMGMGVVVVVEGGIDIHRYIDALIPTLCVCVYTLYICRSPSALPMCLIKQLVAIQHSPHRGVPNPRKKKSIYRNPLTCEHLSDTRRTIGGPFSFFCFTLS